MKKPSRMKADTAKRSPLLSGHDWAAIRAWYRTKGRHHLPWRQGSTPWTILLAETLLHRTRADAIQALYPRITEKFSGPSAIVNRQAEWIEFSKSVGLAWRAVTFVSACQALLARHKGRVPEEREALLALPGVGHYTASAVRCFGFGIPEVIVDSNTIRLAARISGETLDKAHHRSQKVRAMVARLSEDCKPLGPDDNYALLDLAAKICRTSKPRCGECPVQSGCATGRLAYPKALMEESRRSR